MHDPRDKHHSDGFPPDDQDQPGLVGETDPTPDHGEKSYQGNGRLRGRHALITGGDSGIGRAAAIAFAREGADVAIVHLPEEQEDADDTVRLIEDAGRTGVSLAGDVRDEGFAASVVDRAVEALGALDIVVLNAAYQRDRESLAALETEELDRVFRTNLYGLMFTARAAVPHLEAGASIIVTASIQAFDPSPSLIDYAMTKAAMLSFTKSMAKQLGPKGIRVNGVAPGPVWTPLQVSGGATQEKVESFGEHTPLGRPGQPAELASIYVQLAASDASFATGQIYGAAGGSGQP